MSTHNNKDLDMSLDFKFGRSGDWRGAPKDWDIYHPSHDDYQTQEFVEDGLAELLM